MPDQDALEAVRRALDEIERVWPSAVEAVAAADPDAAFEAAEEFASRLRVLSEAAGRLRLESVWRIWDRDRLSLSVLATRIGVSKSRAGAMIEAVEKLKQEESDDDA